MKSERERMKGQQVLTWTTQGIDRCFNVVPCSDKGLIEDFYNYLTQDFAQALKRNEELVLAAAPAALAIQCRFLNKLTAAGCGIAVSPTTAITNQHVVNISPANSDHVAIHNFDSNQYQFIQKGWHMFSVSEFLSRLLVTEKDHQIYDRSIAGIDFDPLSHNKDDFKDFDVEAIKMNDSFKCFLIPSTAKIYPGKTVFAIYHTNSMMFNRSLNITHLPKLYGIDASSRIDDVTTAFSNESGKFVAVGRALAPYKESSDGTIEEDNSGEPLTSYIPHTACSFFGSSGHMLLGEDDKPGTFSGIHIGGTFIKCVECMKRVPLYILHVTEGHKLRGICNSCDANTTCVSLSYNYAMSVHHPTFVTFYRNYILPLFKGKELPKLVEDYLACHQ